jgi:regulator of sirC expression with transglutaminase-like and TPR domain
VDTWAGQLKRRIAADSPAVHRLRALNNFFYRELSFGAAVNDFYSANNSYLHHVIQSRRGIPISLAVLWLELAQAVGLNARGVGFPGHFLVKITLSKGQVVIDPLSGTSLSREDLLERLEPFRKRSGLVGDFEMPLGLYLQAASGRDMLLRMCRNLKEIHAANDAHNDTVQVLNRVLILTPDSHGDRRDRGLALAALGQTQAALEDLLHYLNQAEDALDIDAVADVVEQLRRVT